MPPSSFADAAGRPPRDGFAAAAPKLKAGLGASGAGMDEPKRDEVDDGGATTAGLTGSVVPPTPANGFEAGADGGGGGAPGVGLGASNEKDGAAEGGAGASSFLVVAAAPNANGLEEGATAGAAGAGVEPNAKGEAEVAAGLGAGAPKENPVEGVGAWCARRSQA